MKDYIIPLVVGVFDIIAASIISIFVVRVWQPSNLLQFIIIVVAGLLLSALTIWLCDILSTIERLK